MIIDTETLTVIRLTDHEANTLREALEILENNPTDTTKRDRRLSDEMTDVLEQIRFGL
jgi:hypothetical protein